MREHGAESTSARVDVNSPVRDCDLRGRFTSQAALPDEMPEKPPRPPLQKQIPITSRLPIRVAELSLPRIQPRYLRAGAEL